MFRVSVGILLSPLLRKDIIRLLHIALEVVELIGHEVILLITVPLLILSFFFIPMNALSSHFVVFFLDLAKQGFHVVLIWSLLLSHPVRCEMCRGAAGNVVTVLGIGSQV